MTTDRTTRAVLENVPRIHFYEGSARCPEDIIFPSAVRAMLEYLGDKDFGCRHCLGCAAGSKITCTYSYLAGTSGAGSFMSWGRGWHDDNMALHYMSDDPDAPYRRAFESIGYPVEWLSKEAGENAMKQRIVTSIRELGRPVLAFGVIGPPEPSIITGYDEGGAVLIGWSFFQQFPDFAGGVTYEPSGYFRKRDWFKDTECLCLMGQKQARPDFGKVCREALQWALQVTHTPLVCGDRFNGLAAYDAWAERMAQDSDFPPGDEATLRTVSRYTTTRWGQWPRRAGTARSSCCSG